MPFQGKTDLCSISRKSARSMYTTLGSTVTAVARARREMNRRPRWRTRIHARHGRAEREVGRVVAGTARWLSQSMASALNVHVERRPH